MNEYFSGHDHDHDFMLAEMTEQKCGPKIFLAIVVSRFMKFIIILRIYCIAMYIQHWMNSFDFHMKNALHASSQYAIYYSFRILWET